MATNFDRTLSPSDRVQPLREDATVFLNGPLFQPRESDTLVGVPFEPAQTMTLALLPRPQAGPDTAGQQAA